MIKRKTSPLKSGAAMLLGAAILFVSSSSSVAAKKTGDVQAPRIASVVINGLYNIRERTVIAEMKSRRGSVYDPAKITRDIETLAAMGHFENVEISFDPAYNVVTVDIIEKPYVRKIDFRGNKRFSRGRLLDEITVKEKEFLDKLATMESEAKILALYRDEGYADCSVETITSVDDENRITVNFLVTEGNKILISDVFIRGPKIFNEKKILSLMKTRRKKVYKQDVIENDIKEIENFYKNRGWQEIAISRPEIVFNEARTAMTVLLVISEGVRYRVGEVSFDGHTAVTEKELKKLVALKKNKFYNDERFQETISNIHQIYADKGYLRASASPDFLKNKDAGVMDILLRISEGPVFYLGYVDVTGLTYTQEKVIRREVLLKEGDVFRSGVLRRSLEKIYNLGFLESVEPEIRPTSKENIVDLVINVAEGKPGILTAGAGYSSVDKLVGTLQVQHINLLGRAQRLNLMWEFGERKQNYEISWTEPWFMDRPVSFGIDVFNTERLREYGTIYSAYRESRKGGALRVGPRLSDILSLLFSYSYEEIGIFDISAAAAASPYNITQSRNITSSLSSQIVRDSRDNIFDATRGYTNSLSLQYAGGIMGGDVNFIKSVGATSWYLKTFWKFVLSTNLRIGWIGAFPPSPDVPIYEKFYVGGAETVRGYRYRGEIGPDGGGRAMMVANVEYKFPIVQERNRTILQGAFFYDIGGAWNEFGDMNMRTGMSENDLKSGVGFGIRFTTPVFPIRLDWGHGLNHKAGEDPSQFYFTIGQIF
ncbi:MAG: outer membrane protein assembly factor BamA [Endomicrobiia bacterium]|nr:outer membrane protein assembly factor BamA [Endomicrobiia bacterium]